MPFFVKDSININVLNEIAAAVAAIDGGKGGEKKGRLRFPFLYYGYMTVTEGVVGGMLYVVCM